MDKIVSSNMFVIYIMYHFQVLNFIVVNIFLSTCMHFYTKISEKFCPNWKVFAAINFIAHTAKYEEDEKVIQVGAVYCQIFLLHLDVQKEKYKNHCKYISLQNRLLVLISR